MEMATTVKYENEYFAEYYDDTGSIYHRTAKYASLKDLEERLNGVVGGHIKPFAGSYTIFKIKTKTMPIKRVDL